MPRHIKSGDTVMVTAGDFKGRTGTVLKVIPKRDQVIVQGINTKTKHLKPSQMNPQGAVVTKEMPLHVSNVSPVDKSGRATRVRFEVKKDRSKVRVAVRDGSELSVVRSAPAKSKKTKKA
ncbi:MAG: 50S ribosomal protein L24 [Planctomycetes bacterium]|nr:50S ribosomal protein L24 [Planctomycetota bacterium]NOG54821.1 50S ribosomal protein L24 [Planctomycetota bacterium]